MQEQDKTLIVRRSVKRLEKLGYKGDERGRKKALYVVTDSTAMHQCSISVKLL